MRTYALDHSISGLDIDTGFLIGIVHHVELPFDALDLARCGAFDYRAGSGSEPSDFGVPP